MNNVNLDHALNIYMDLKRKKKDVTNDLGQLYFAIVMLGDEVSRLQKKISNESTRVFTKKK